MTAGKINAAEAVVGDGSAQRLRTLNRPVL